ncbi:Os01g0937850, partial [Oryza sativa Japonica Group]
KGQLPAEPQQHLVEVEHQKVRVQLLQPEHHRRLAVHRHAAAGLHLEDPHAHPARRLHHVVLGEQPPDARGAGELQVDRRNVPRRRPLPERERAVVAQLEGLHRRHAHHLGVIRSSYGGVERLGEGAEHVGPHDGVRRRGAQHDAAAARAGVHVERAGWQGRRDVPPVPAHRDAFDGEVVAGVSWVRQERGVREAFRVVDDA